MGAQIWGDEGGKLRFSDTPRKNRMSAQGPHDNKGESGSAIWFLFLAIFAFGALAYALLQGSRGNLSMIENEAAKTVSYQSQDCSNSVDMAVKRLNMRGCGALISLEADGSNPNAGAPVDGSCSVYHPNGGGAKPCDINVATAPAITCETGPIGTVCDSDGAFYIGDMDGKRIYAAAADQPAKLRWKTGLTATSGTSSTTDGLANTNAMIAAGAAAHPAAKACKDKAPAGTWYLPAYEETYLIWTNGAAIDIPAKGFSAIDIGDYYWSSTEFGASPINARTMSYFTDFPSGIAPKNMSWRVRCFRR